MNRLTLFDKSVGSGLANVSAFYDDTVAQWDWDRNANSNRLLSTYPHPRHVIKSRCGRSLDCSLGHGELAGEAREGALVASIPAEDRTEKVPCLHEVGAPRLVLVRSRRWQQPRGSRCLPRARLNKKLCIIEAELTLTAKSGSLLFSFDPRAQLRT